MKRMRERSNIKEFALGVLLFINDDLSELGL